MFVSGIGYEEDAKKEYINALAQMDVNVSGDVTLDKLKKLYDQTTLKNKRGQK